MGFGKVIHRCYNSGPGALVVKVTGCDRSAFSGTRDLLVSSTRGTFKHQFLLGDQLWCMIKFFSVVIMGLIFMVNHGKCRENVLYMDPVG